MGRKDIRDIIIEERSKGKTVFFSSHILSDIEHLCDRVAIVVGGVVRREGELSALLQSESRSCEILVRDVSDLTAKFIAESATQSTDLGGNAWKLIIPRTDVSPFVAKLLQSGVILDEVQPHQDSLEDLFVRVSAEEGNT